MISLFLSLWTLSAPLAFADPNVKPCQDKHGRFSGMCGTSGFGFTLGCSGGSVVDTKPGACASGYRCCILDARNGEACGDARDAKCRPSSGFFGCGDGFESDSGGRDCASGLRCCKPIPGYKAPAKKADTPAATKSGSKPESGVSSGDGAKTEGLFEDIGKFAGKAAGSLIDGIFGGGDDKKKSGPMINPGQVLGKAVDAIAGTSDSGLGKAATAIASGIVSGKSASASFDGVVDAVKSRAGNQFDQAYNDIAGGAAGPDGKFEVESYASQFNTIGQHKSVREYALNVINFFLSFLGLVGTAAVIYAGTLYVTARGEDGEIDKAKKIISFASIGIILVMGSFAIVNTIIKNAGTGGQDRDGAAGAAAALAGVSGLPSSTTTYSDGTEVTTTINPDGTKTVTTVAPDGTKTTVTTPLSEAGPGASNLSPSQQNLVDALFNVSPIVVHGEEPSQIKDYGDGVWISPEYAVEGVKFGVSQKVDAMFDFGNGVKKRLNTRENEGATVSHIYSEPGRKLVRAIAQTENGLKSYQKTLVVGGIDPVINLYESAQVGVPIPLDASASKSYVGSIVKYKWECGQGTGCEEGPKTSATFTQTGTHEIKLTLVTNFGAERSVSYKVKIYSNEELPVDFSWE